MENALDRATRAASVALISALMLPHGASAQTQQGQTSLEEITVSGNQSQSARKQSSQSAAQPAAATPPQRAEDTRGPTTASSTGAVNGFVATDTTTGSKSPTAIEDIPQFVSVVGRDEIDTQGAQKADEALRYTSGVFTQPFGSDSDMNWFFIRGFDATQKGTYLDGLQLYNHAFGSFYIDSFALERIEVLKGPASVLYGGSNPGGIINYVSKRPTGERLRYLETGINDAGNAYLGFDVGDRASPAIDYRVTGRIAGGDDYSDFQDGFRGFISPTLRWSDDRTSFTLLANYSHVDEIHGGGAFLPYVGTVVTAPYGRIPRDANYTEPDIDTYEREQGSIGYEFEHKLTPDLIIRQNARYSAADVKEVQLYANGYTGGDPASGSLERVNFGHDTTVSTFLIDNQVEWRVGGPFAEHTILAGVDYKYFNIDQVQGSALFGTTTPINVVNPIYGVPQTPRVSYLDQDLTQEQIGTYIQDQIRFGGGWLITLNGRYDWVTTDVHDRPNGYSPPGFPGETKKSDDGEASGRAGIAYTFDNGLTPYASAATYFNPVIGTTAEGDLFVPETGQQYEVGFKYVPRFVDAIVTASLFDITRQNVLTANPNNIFAQIQTGEVTSRGFEIEAKANLTEQLRASAAFTAMDIEITKDTNTAIVGNRPFVVPEVMASLFADYTFRGNALDGISIGGGVRYLGSSYADQENTLKVPDVTLFDARIGYDWDHWGIALNVTNIFDEKYVSSCQGENVCSYGEGRVIKLKSHVTW